MLLKEFSLDPELFLEPELIKGLIRDFSLDKGRVLSLAPKSWFRLALENLNQVTDPKYRKEAEILITTLQNWKTQRIAIRSPARKNTQYTEPWLMHIESFVENPFDGVLTLKSSKHSISPEDIWKEPPSWQVDSCITIPILAKKIIKYLERAFTLSKVIYILDPYFNLEDGKYWAIWDELAGIMSKYPHIEKVVILTADHKSSTQVCGRNKARLNALRGVEIWQIKKEDIASGFHDRFILTDFAGFSLSNSLQEKPDEFMEIVRLTTKSYELRKNQYLTSFNKYEKVFP